MNDQAAKLREIVRQKNISNLSEPRGEIDRNPSKIPKSISITSGKGGVGKSSLAVLFGMSLSNINKRVLLFDADLGLANVHLLLGMAPKYSLLDVVEGKRSFEEIITKVNEKIDIIPGASGIEKIANLDILGVKRLKEEFIKLESKYDVLLIDTAAGISSNVIHFASGTDLTLVIMTPEPTSLADAYSLIKILKGYKTEHIGVIVNMVFSEREGREIFDKLKTLVVKFLDIRLEYIGSLPYLEEVTKYIRKVDLLGLERKDGLFYQRIRAMCNKIYQTPVKKSEGFLERIMKGLKGKREI